MKKILSLFLILLAGCTKQEYIEGDPDTQTRNDISAKNDDFVSKVKASDVSNLFFSDLLNKGTNKVSGTKTSGTETGKTLKSVETLYYEGSGTPAMYLINYNGGGFVIISATKSYYPILAYSDNNSLRAENINNINDGLTMWMEGTKLAIKKSNTLPEETISKMRGLWNAYETQNSAVSKKTTTSSYTYEEYMKFYERMSQLYLLCPGYSFGTLSSAQSFLSTSEYNNLVDKANFYGSPLECTIVGYKSRPVQEVGPLIGTQWHQNNSFNNLCENQYPAGCVAIAMGQIMKFHRFPASYNWDSMPNNYGTFDTQTLIRDIGRAVDMDYDADGSGATNGHTKDGFLSMGYSVLVKDHNYVDVQNELFNQRRPVYMTGDRERILGVITYKGHAWVCEGARSVDQTVNYFIEYLLNDNTYSSLDGPSWQSPTSSAGYTYLYFYQNWGWGTSGGNGWYGHDNVNTQVGNYQYGRENFYVHPN